MKSSAISFVFLFCFVFQTSAPFASGDGCFGIYGKQGSPFNLELRLQQAADGPNTLPNFMKGKAVQGPLPSPLSMCPYVFSANGSTFYDGSLDDLAWKNIFQFVLSTDPFASLAEGGSFNEEMLSTLSSEAVQSRILFNVIRPCQAFRVLSVVNPDFSEPVQIPQGGFQGQFGAVSPCILSSPASLDFPACLQSIRYIQTAETALGVANTAEAQINQMSQQSAQRELQQDLQNDQSVDTQSKVNEAMQENLKRSKNSSERMATYFGGAGAGLLIAVGRMPSRGKVNTNACTRLQEDIGLTGESANTFNACCAQAGGFPFYQNFFFPNTAFKRSVRGYLASIGIQVGGRLRSAMAARQAMDQVGANTQQTQAPGNFGGMVVSECEHNPAACEGLNYEPGLGETLSLGSGEGINWSTDSDDTDQWAASDSSGGDLPGSIDGFDNTSDDEFSPPVPSGGLGANPNGGGGGGGGAPPGAAAGRLQGADPNEAGANAPAPDNSINKKGSYTETRRRLGGQATVARGGNQGKGDGLDSLKNLFGANQNAGPTGGAEIDSYGSIGGRNPASFGEGEDIGIASKGLFERISERYDSVSQTNRLLKYEFVPE